MMTKVSCYTFHMHKILDFLLFWISCISIHQCHGRPTLLTEAVVVTVRSLKIVGLNLILPLTN